MTKSKIFIASSSRTLVLAEMLRDELAHADFCAPKLWTEESRSKPGATIIEILEDAAEQYDFAVVILARDDLLSAGEGDTLKARDNCVFEAGLFVSAIGRKRCFLVNSVRQQDLPSDLAGVNTIPFKEPTDLTSRAACSDAIAAPAAQVKNAVQQVMRRDGPAARGGRQPVLSVLSVDEVLRRERPVSQDGDLAEDRVIVVDTVPAVDVDRAKLVYNNIQYGNSYHYLYYYSADTLDKICHLLQMVAWAAVTQDAAASDSPSRLREISSKKTEVVDALSELCRSSRLRLTLITTEPTTLLRTHNASDPTTARTYLKRFARGREEAQFVLWSEGENATKVWRSLNQYLDVDKNDRLFLPLKNPPFPERLQELEQILTRCLERYFPAIGEKVKQICLGLADERKP